MGPTPSHLATETVARKQLSSKPPRTNRVERGKQAASLGLNSSDLSFLFFGRFFSSLDFPPPLTI